MKKSAFISLIAMVIGVILSYIFVKGYQSQSIESKKVNLIVIQTGVYQNLNNAKECQGKSDHSVIIEDQTLYRVIVGASFNDYSLAPLEEKLKSQNIPYYKRNLVLDTQSKTYQELESVVFS